MSRLLRRSGTRWLLRHPWPSGLSLLGVALGVAVVAGVDLATGSARLAFLAATEAVSGRATHQVLGGPIGLADSTYARVRMFVDEAAPVVEAYVRAPAFPGRTFRVLGVDPFAEAPFRPYVATGSGLPLAPLLTTPGAVVLSAAVATELGLATGDTLALIAGGGRRTAVVAGLLEPADALARAALADVLLADIATAQELAGSIGRISRIDLRLAGPDALEEVRSILPAGARVVDAGERAATTAAMTRAFEVNLAALSLLALVFGLFLVYNAVTFSVLRRRPLIGLERALGVTRGQVVVRVVGEAVAIGAVATLLGFGLGILLAGGLVHLVARTINDLHFALTVTELRFGPGTVMRAALLGIAGSALAALPAALQAAGTTPGVTMLRSSLEHGARARALPLLIGGLVLAGAGVLVGLAPGAGLRAGFAALFALILGGALVAPAVAVAVSRAMRPIAARAAGTAGSIAARGVAASLSRTGPAIAALAVAVAAVLAVGIVVGSFRGAVEAWLGNALRADVYVSSPGALSNRAEGTLEPSLVRGIRGSPLTSGITTYRNVVLPLAGGDLRLSAVDLHPPHRRGFELIQADADPWRAFDAGGLLISEALAWRRDLAPGDTLRLPTDRGTRAFPVAAVFRDYTTEHGLIFLARSVYDANWTDTGVTSIGVFARPGVTTDSLVDDLRPLAPDDAAVTFTRTRELREGSLAVFDRTFAITSVLRALALVVALVGVLGALMALQLERARELGVLRAIGLTPGGLGAVVAAQTLLIGVAAAVLALPLGLALGALMLKVVNRRSFGWTVPLQLEPRLLAEAVLLALAAALLAGAYPAWRMARTRPAEALRAE